MHKWSKTTLSLLRNERVMNNWQFGQTLLDCDANSRGTQLHLNALCVNLGITTMHLMVCLRGEKMNVCLWKVIGYAWEEDWFTISVSKFVQFSSNPDELVNIGDIPNRNITLPVVNKITAKQS